MLQGSTKSDAYLIANTIKPIQILPQYHVEAQKADQKYIA
jgi:hypothetical protein